MSVSDGQQRALPPQVKSFFQSSALLAVNTPETIFTPGSNTNGAWIDKATITTASATGMFTSLIVATSAPGGVNVAGSILQVVSNVAGTYFTAQLQNGIFIPPGYGAYFIDSVANTGALRSCAYTLL